MSCLKIGTEYLSSEFLLPGNSEIIFSLFSLFTKSFGIYCVIGFPTYSILQLYFLKKSISKGSIEYILSTYFERLTALDLFQAHALGGIK